MTVVQAATTYSAVVGQIVMKLREAKGLRQVDLAAALGVHQGTWSKVERGACGFTLEQLGVVARFLGTKPGALLQEADDSVDMLERDGVKVHAVRDGADVDTRSVLISAAALARLLA